jgi:hypothetical protein
LETGDCHMYHYLLRTVKILLGGAIAIVFLRALFFPNVLDVFLLLLLFLILVAMFIGT